MGNPWGYMKLTTRSKKSKTYCWQEEEESRIKNLHKNKIEGWSAGFFYNFLQPICYKSTGTTHILFTSLLISAF